MKEIACALLVTACTTDIPATGHAAFADAPTVISARAQQGFVSYGAPFHQWTISLLAADGCDTPPVGSVEIDTLSGVTDVPIGATMLRTTEQLQTAPSAFVRYMNMATVSGTITITTASTQWFTGELDAQLAGGSLSGTFTARVCP